MVNKSAKGLRKERECRKLLEKQGYKCVFKSIRWRYGTLDFAGLFDSVFVREVKEPQIEWVREEWLFVSNKHFQGYHLQHQKDIVAFKEQYGFDSAKFQLW